MRPISPHTVRNHRLKSPIGVRNHQVRNGRGPKSPAINVPFKVPLKPADPNQEMALILLRQAEQCNNVEQKARLLDAGLDLIKKPNGPETLASAHGSGTGKKQPAHAQASDLAAAITGESVKKKREIVDVQLIVVFLIYRCFQTAMMIVNLMIMMMILKITVTVLHLPLKVLDIRFGEAYQKD